MEKQARSRSFSYSVFSFVTDEMKGTAIPVGVALWGSESDTVWTKFADQREHIKGLNKAAYFRLREFARNSGIGSRQEKCHMQWKMLFPIPTCGGDMSLSYLFTRCERPHLDRLTA